MRVQAIPPEELSPEQKPLYESMKAGVEAHLKGFVSARADGALIGPFPAMLRFPQVGAAAWGVFTALTAHSTLPKPAHEAAILVVGARLGSRYELYSHEVVAGQAGLSAAKIATIAAGERPSDLTVEEAAAYDVASLLSRGGQLPESTYQAALAAFGEAGVAELVYLTGCYAMISMLLNAYDVPVPGRGDDDGGM